MKREQIRQAAKDYAAEILGLDYIGQVETKKSFINGADWRINSVWHDARNEVPDRFKFILVVKDDERFSLNVANGKMTSCPMFWKRWAYIDELLPERKEEAE